MQGNSGKRDNRILKISMITLAVITCLFAVLKVANVFDVTKVATKTAAFVKNGFKFGTGTESDGTIDSIVVNGTTYSTNGNNTINITLSETMDDMVTVTANKKNESQVVEGEGNFLLDGNNNKKISISVTSADKSSNTVYNLNITKPSSNKLSSLAIAGVAISPEFDPDVSSYTAKVLTTINKVDVSATACDRNAVVTITGDESVHNGANEIRISVHNDSIAEDRAYTINLTATDTIEMPYSFRTSPYEFATPFTGNFKMECWGAQGGGTGGKGAYTSGTLNLKKNDKFYVYVGNKPARTENAYNGGGEANNSHYPTDDGGGATDIRLVSGEWNNFDSLKSRIMVAAAGGGSESYWSGVAGGAGGALTGMQGSYTGSGSYYPLGGTQTAGGRGDTSSNPGQPGGFGYGGHGDLPWGGRRRWLWILRRRRWWKL